MPPAARRWPSSKNNASISQTVTLDAGVYNLSLLAAQRVNYQTQNRKSRS